MKKIKKLNVKISYILSMVVIVTILLASYTTNAQVAINKDGSAPNSSAMLDVKATDGGLLIPRMTATERDDISSPASGLMVYVTSDNKFWYYDGAQWINWVEAADGDWTVSGSNMYSAVSGNVGIGTTNFIAKLSIAGMTSDKSIQTGEYGTNGLSSTNFVGTRYYWNTDNLQIGLRDYGDDRKDAVFNIEQSQDNFRFQVGGSDIVLIGGGGNVGIGTVSPGTYKLNVNGTGIFTSALTLTGQTDNADGYNRDAYWNYDSKVGLVMKTAADDGSIAILFPSTGNAASDFAYIVYDEDYGEAGVSAGENGALILGAENDGQGSSDHVRIKSRLVVEADMYSSDPISAFEVKSGNVESELFKVLRTGNVGIWEETPLTKLHVSGTHPGAGTGDGNDSDAPSEAIIVGGSTGSSRKNDWPNGWGGGLSTWDICGASAYMSGYVTRSDKRYKKEITSLKKEQDIKAKFMQLRPVDYYFNPATLEANPIDYEKKQYGFIANEVEEIFPDIVVNAGTEKNIRRGLNYNAFIPITIEIVQQQQTKIDYLEQEIKELKVLVKQLAK